MNKICKYCGIRYNWSNYKLHTHCREAYNKGQLLQMFSKEEAEDIKKMIKRLKPFVK